MGGEIRSTTVLTPEAGAFTVDQGLEADRLMSLDKPSLEGLSYVLRRKELWPEGFVWDYSTCECCAMGLAHKLWGEYIKTADEVAVEEAFGLDTDAVDLLFFGGDWAPTCTYRTIKKGWFWDTETEHEKTMLSAVTPEMVADQIDAYLSAQE